MPKSSKDDSPQREALDEFVRATRRAAALKAALELDLFTRVAEGYRSLPALLRVTGYNERALRMLLDALANIGLLTKSPFDYALAATAEAFLVRGKPTFCGDALLAQLAWEPRSQLAKSVRSGKPVSALVANGGARSIAARAGATWAEWAVVVDEFAGVWEQFQSEVDKAAPLRALAFGVEAGLRMLSLAKRSEQTRIVVVDAGAAFTPLRNTVEALQVQAQIEWLDGDWLTASLPTEPFALALVDSLTAYYSLEHNIGILHRAYEALQMGGRIVLRAPIADDERRGPGWVPLAGLDILMASAVGDIYTVTEYRGMLEAAGFFEVKQVGAQIGVLTARRIPPPPPPPPAPTVAPDFIPPPETLS